MLGALRVFLRCLLCRDRFERELTDELQFHLEARVEDLVRRGLPPEEARRRARIEFGGVEQYKERLRTARPGALVDTVLQDIRLGLRLMRRAPGVSAAVVLTLALVMGLNAAVFAVLDAEVLWPLPFPACDRLVALYNVYPKLVAADRGQNAIPDYFDRRELPGVFESLALFLPETRNVGAGSALLGAPTYRITPTAFEVLGVRPVLGRPFSQAEAEPGGDRVAILGYGLWQRAFGGSPSAVGASIRIDGVPHQIVGVMPRAFALLDRVPDLLVPLAPTDGQRGFSARHVNVADMVGRLRPGVTLEQAQAHIDSLNAANLGRYPDLRPFVERSGFRTVVRSLKELTVGDVRPILVLMQAGALLVLVIGCANIANLLLIRSHARLQELALRSAMGAGQWRIGRQLTIESLCLAATGTVLGLPVAYGLLGLLGRVPISRIQTIGRTGLDGRVLAFAVVLCVMAALAFGALPALQLSRRGLEGLLHRTGRTGTSDRRASVVRGLLVVTEVALAVVLAVGAGLLGLSLARAASLRPGFSSDGVLTARLLIGETVYPDDRPVQVFAQRVVDAVNSVPGVRHAAVTTVVPFSSDDNLSTISVEAATADSAQSIPLPHQSWIAGRYFAALEIPLIQGRTFDRRDTEFAPGVAIVDSVFAERNWPGQSPLGRRISRGSSGSGPWLTVVGVVGTTKYHQLTESPGHGSVYFPQTQPGGPLRLRRAMNIVVRSDGDPAALAPAVQGAVLTVDPDLPLFDVLPMGDRVSGSLLHRRLPALLATAFSTLGLLLAVLGVYSVTAFGVTQRLREVGIRLALGAPPLRVVSQVAGRGAMLVVVGIVLGLAGAVAMGRGLGGVLYGVVPIDAGVLAIVLTIVLGAGLLGCLVPARRAGRVDVAAMLRQE